MSAEERENTQKSDEKPFVDDGGHVRNQNYIEERASERSGIHKDTIKVAFDAMWDSICEELENGNEVKMHGKGSWYLSRRSPRVGRNPVTGEEYDVPEREAMAFRTSPAYAKRLRERRKEIAKQRMNREAPSE
ncbi:HU family DNA-binding protein [Evansella clarkii]|uniref:HU family DNA-binding protein n=1 Tax=Evansella clarkii TaxID=79879 RepID=UPI001475D682|nr:HU family DNA-binding protein [Evansella clarkii]